MCVLVTTEMALDPAEQNGELIIEEIMQKILHTHGIPATRGGAYGDPNHGGLYMFTVKNRTSEYPVYVGYTGRSFRRRFGEHANRGVIRDFHQEIYPQPHWNNYSLHVYTYSGDYAAAKLLESIFLRSFDFARNTEENNREIRPKLLLTRENPPEDSKASFMGGYHAIMDYVKDIQGKFSDLVG